MEYRQLPHGNGNEKFSVLGVMQESRMESIAEYFHN